MSPHRRVIRWAGRRMTLIAVSVAVAMAAGAIVGGVIVLATTSTSVDEQGASLADVRRIVRELRRTQRQIQRSRLENTYRACRRENHEHELNLVFLRLLQVPPPVLEAARRTYAIEPDCWAVARERVLP